MQIHVAVQGQQLGVFDLESLNAQIAQGAIPASTALAWFEGCPEWIPVGQVPGVVIPASAQPPTQAGPPPLPPIASMPAADGTGGLIPYKNPKALTAYYLGIFGLFPAIGFFLAIPAVILGVLGLKARNADPRIKGVVHAWVGIVLGSISVLYHLVALAAITLNG